MSYGLKGIEKLLKDIEERQQKAEKKAHNKRVGYSPKCKVCNSEHLDEIEKLREDGFTYKQILEELGISEKDISIMSLSRHFQKHYPKSQDYKARKKIEMLEKTKEAYTKYPFLEDYFKNKDIEDIEEFIYNYGFCTDWFEICEYIPAGKVMDCNGAITYLIQQAHSKANNPNRYFIPKDEKNEIYSNCYRQQITCLSCKDDLNSQRLDLLEKIISFNFLNITPENRELYFNLLQFDGNPEEFIQLLTKVKEENQPDK